MGNNSSKWDRDAAYNGLTIKQLNEKLEWWKARQKENPSVVGRLEMAHIKVKIAERIGIGKK